LQRYGKPLRVTGKSNNDIFSCPDSGQKWDLITGKAPKEFVEKDQKGSKLKVQGSKLLHLISVIYVEP